MIETAAAIAQLIANGAKITTQVIELVDRVAAERGVTRQEVFGDVAAAARQQGQQAAVSLATQASRLGSASLDAYESLSPTRQALISAGLPVVGPWLPLLRQMRTRKQQNPRDPDGQGTN